ncbi:MAG: L-fuconate dehydratase [Planctomycetota bacterium]
MTVTITGIEVLDVRFPTSDELDGSDAMHTDPDYSAAYVVLRTNQPGLDGHGLTFTIGRGTEIVCAACEALAPLVQGRTLDGIESDFAGFWRALTSESQLRWVGPEKGVLHLATAAVINAVWDLVTKRAGKPLWRYLVDLSPEEFVGLIDFRYITDALTPDQALEILRANESTKATRVSELERDGYPAYTTSVGWLGYDDEKIDRLAREAVADGWTHFKMKVGADLADDRRRASILRTAIGPDRKLMMDANQRWDVDQAIEWMSQLAEFEPWWIEEPTSPDDVLGHQRVAQAIAPIGVATGEQCQNRVIFKQLLQADAISFCQIDSCRLGSVNEILAVMLMAKRFDVPVCPHAGGVGLCEYVNHLIMVDYARISASFENRVAEWVDHLHEHFEAPARVVKGAYLVPDAAGYGITMKTGSLEQHRYPDGPLWRERLARTRNI